MVAPNVVYTPNSNFNGTDSFSFVVSDGVWTSVTGVITVNVNPLRDHIDDLSLYIERFGLEFTAKNDIAFKGFTSEAIQLMKKFSWPGNIRELKNTVESLIVMNKGKRITNDMVKDAPTF